jgi:hypothetical protein
VACCSFSLPGTLLERSVKGFGRSQGTVPSFVILEQQGEGKRGCTRRKTTNLVRDKAKMVDLVGPFSRPLGMYLVVPEEPIISLPQGSK